MVSGLSQTSVAAGLSWYIAHDLLGHPQPFFAPIAAAVSLSISNVLRAQRAIQMMIGVTLGIGMGIAWCRRCSARGRRHRGRRVHRAVRRGVHRSRLHRARDDVRQPDRRFVDPGAGPVSQRCRFRAHLRRADRRRPGDRRSPSCCSRPTRSRCCAARASAVLRRAARRPVAYRGLRRRTQGGPARLAAVGRRSGARTARRADPGARHRPSGGADRAAAVGPARRRAGRRSPGRACGPARRFGAAAGPRRRCPPLDGCRIGFRSPCTACWSSSRPPRRSPTPIPPRRCTYVAAARQHASQLQSDARETNRGGARRRRPGVRR